MTVVIALIRIPPSVAAALVQMDEEVRAGVAPRQRDARVLDGLEVLVFFWLRAGGHVVSASHGEVLCWGEAKSPLRAGRRQQTALWYSDLGHALEVTTMYRTIWYL
jgi:hypothetical protein